MKGLKKIALVSAVAAISAGAQAELKALDDSAMGELTGQKGLTIDLQTKHTIGEFAYHDAGMVVFKDLSLGANSNTALHNINQDGLLDNARITIDVAGSGALGDDGIPDNYLNYANSEVAALAELHVKGFGNKDAGMKSASISGGGTDGNGDLIGSRKAYGDGDLVIHIGFTDAWQYGGGLASYLAGTGSDGLGALGVDAGAGTTSMSDLTYAGAYEIVRRSVDFNSSIGKIGIAGSAEVANVGSVDMKSAAELQAEIGNGFSIFDSTPNTTTLISELSINGYLGSMDISIENHGNGFSGGQLGGGAAGTGAADSKIHWDTFFDVTDLSVYIDIAGVKIEGMKINNTRGDLTSLNNETAVVDPITGEVTYVASTGDGSAGFAHSKRTIYAVNEDVVNAAEFLDPATNRNGFVDGVAINTEFKGDMEIEALSFGDTGVSIGSLYWTDIRSTTNWTISAH